MPAEKEIDELKKALVGAAGATLGELWGSAEDRKFLSYNAEKLARYALQLRDAKTRAQKDEAQFNLDMIKTSLTAYFHQKQITTAKKVEEVAPQIVGFVIKVLLATV